MTIASTIVRHWDTALLLTVLTLFGPQIVATCEPLATYIVQESGDPFGWLEPILIEAPAPAPHVDAIWV